MRIIVIGAYGFTGQLICRELDKNNMPYAIAGRDESKLLATKSQFKLVQSPYIGDIANMVFVNQIIENSDLFINCAGPFTEESADFLAAIATSGKAYIDISGELGFARDSHKQLNAKAKASNSIILMGCAFESLLVDLAAQDAIKNREVTEINTYYWFNKHLVSPGTRITMKLSKFRDVLKIENGNWTDCDIAKNRYSVSMSSINYTQIAIPYPLPEVAFFNWTLKPDRASSFLLLPEDEARYIKPSEHNQKSLNDTYSRLRRLKKKGPSAEERATQHTKIVLEIKFEDSTKTHVVIENTDMYQTTAKAILVAAQQIIKTKKRPSGVLNPAQIFKGIELETLNRLGCQIIKNEEFKVQKC